MKYYRIQDSFYKVASITPQTRPGVDQMVLIEYSEVLGVEPKTMDLGYTLPNGNGASLVMKNVWDKEAQEIQEIDYFVWRHIGAPSSKEEK